jgi:hypothetical protein
VRTLVCPIGLGDSIVMSGAAIVLSKRFGRLRVPCFRPYLESVSSFYVNYPDIKVYPVDHVRGQHWGRPFLDDFEIKGEAILCGHYLELPMSPDGKASSVDRSWPEWIYGQLDIDYKDRWDSCPIPLACERVKQIEICPKVFVHEDSSRGFTILKSISKDAYHPIFGKGSILEHAFAIQNSSEIHVIDSSMFNLVECLETKADLYLHRYSRCYRKIWFDFPSRKKWNIITRRRGDWKTKHERILA